MNSSPDSRGLTMSAAHPATAARFEDVLDHYISFHGDPMGGLDAILADDPDCVLAHVLKTCFMLYQTRRRLDAPIAAGIATLERLNSQNPRERLHLAALQAWSGGHWQRAARHYSVIRVRTGWRPANEHADVSAARRQPH
jgi:hypothetical protein